MATVIIMPRQGQSVESCVITAWNKKVGDAVAVDDVLFSYETDKSSFDEKSTVAGTILAVYAEDGDDVPCLEPVCVIGEPGEDISSIKPTSAASEAPKAEEKTTTAKADVPAAATPAASAAKPADGFMRISPRARNLAERTDADLSKATPTGPMGRIIERDVNALLDKGLTKLAASREEVAAAPTAAAPAVTAEAYTDVKLSNIRKVIAKSMHASLAEMAQLTLNSSFDATQLLAYRASLKAGAEKLGLANITINDMVLFAVAKTLGGHKELNANYLADEGIMRYFSSVNLGIAVDTDRGLLVPTLVGAEKLTLNELSVQAKELIKGAQGGTISPDKLKNGSFTVTNLGSMGVESFTPVINPPQTGILGVDCVTYRVKADGTTYPAMGLSLTFDHRALDGAPAARFLKELCENLENFNLMLAK